MHENESWTKNEKTSELNSNVHMRFFADIKSLLYLRCDHGRNWKKINILKESNISYD